MILDTDLVIGKIYWYLDKTNNRYFPIKYIDKTKYKFTCVYCFQLRDLSYISVDCSKLSNIFSTKKELLDVKVQNNKLYPNE